MSDWPRFPCCGAAEISGHSEECPRVRAAMKRLERLDARPVPPQGIVGNPDKGRHGVTNIVELEGR